MHRIPLAVSTRGSRIDALHYGSIAVVNADGEILYSANDPHFPTYLRSSIKMLQALPLIMSGGWEKFDFTDREVAVAVASHVGADYHVSTVRQMLDKLGLGEEDLRCGPQEPDDPEERKRLLCSGMPPSQLHNNCSGKHAGMLATCLMQNWPLDNYIAVDHPLQVWIHELLSEYSGISRDLIGIGVDGCSLPCFYIPISGAATAIARFMARSQTDPGGPDATVRRCVAAFPEMINDHGGFDSELVRVTAGRMVAKRGAMAMFLIGALTVQHGPIGVAIKLEDGNMTPVPMVAMKVLRELELLSDDEAGQLERFDTLPIHNWRGIRTGEVTPNFSLTQPTNQLFNAPS